MVIMRRNMDIQSLNVRTFDNIEFASLQVQKSDEGTEGYTLSDWNGVVLVVDIDCVHSPLLIENPG